jgi:diguanylate cyclase (GGDEF)-like protein/PAS domain S-box-containing protein
MNVLPEIERERLERAISIARILGGLLSLAVGPFLPNVGLGFVVAYGAMLIAYGVVAIRFDRASVSLGSELRFAKIITAADASFAALALLIYSPDPAWTIAPASLPLIIVAASRLGASGAFAAAAICTVGYVGGAALRTTVFGYPLSPAPLLLLLGLAWMTAALLAGIQRESQALRQARSDLYEPLLAAQSRLGELVLVMEGGYAAYVSDAVPELTGYTMAELKRSRLRDLFPEAVIPARVPGRTNAARHFEATLARRAGETVYVEVAMTDLPDLHGVVRSLLVARNITRRRLANAELERLAIHDGLTGLPNRALLQDRLERALLDMAASGSVAVLYLGLDRFKDFNDAFGHDGGDELLVGVASCLSGALGPRDTLARYEGDEFVAVIVDPGVAVVAKAEDLLRCLEGGVAIRGQMVHPEATVGIAVCAAQGIDAHTLIRQAEAAMLHAKRASLPMEIYAPEHEQNKGDRLALLNDLRHAIAGGELALVFQPIVAMATGACVSVECLLRWQHPTRGAVQPMTFIPLAEESGLIRQIGLWVIEEAARNWATWRPAGPGVSLNLSMRNLRMPELHAAIAATLEKWQLPRGALTIEITESVIMEQPQRVMELLRELEDIGVRASVDDYGTGYSSLAYLKDLAVRELKIDRAFVADLSTNPHSETIVRSTIDLAHDLGLVVVAEGIEDQAAWDALSALGCDHAQGYFIARPMSAEALIAWLSARLADEPLALRSA